MGTLAGHEVDQGYESYALKVPEAVDEWLCTSERLSGALWLGPAGEDGDVALETLARLWNPRHYGETLSSAR